MMRHHLGSPSFLLVLSLSLLLMAPASLWASFASVDKSNPCPRERSSRSEARHDKIVAEWGGHLKVRGTASRPDDDSILQKVGTGTYFDGNIEGRLKNKLFLESWGVFELHYEALYSRGDTLRKEKKLGSLFPALSKMGWLFSQPVEDDRRFLDLTKTIHQSDSSIFYHRLDRLSLTLLPKWGLICVGRQAITWGNGLIFNPMDLFNPFPPGDIERDYKTGDDMVSTQFSVNKVGDFQFLYVPRRDPLTGDVEGNQSSLAGKMHFALGTKEFDLMGAKHFGDKAIGFGSTGYLADAAWRLDMLWMIMDNADTGMGADDYFSLVANMDYSWAWWGKNFYGFLEFYYNGLGDDHYGNILTDPSVVRRLNRGELFSLGRAYISGHIRAELHPLFNVFLTVINNLGDPSGLIQPHATWDIAQDVEVSFGGNIFYGAKGTEYGGFKIPGTSFLYKAPNSAFLWISYFF